MLAQGVSGERLNGAAINKTLVASRFSAAAGRYGDGAALQQAGAAALLARLGHYPHGRRLLDLGCGTGAHLPALATHAAELLAVDLAPKMVACAEARGYPALVADAEQLPLANGSVDRIFSNLMVQWLDGLGRVLAECQRLLQPGGVALISTLAEGSLAELASAFSAADGRAHINRFLPLAQIEAQVQAAGFTRAEVSLQPFVSRYDEVRALLRELKTLGANALVGEARHQPLSRRQLQAMADHYEQWRDADGLLPASWQLVVIELQRGWD